MKWKLAVVVITITLAMASPFTWSADADNSNTATAVPGKYVFKLKSGVRPESVVLAVTASAQISSISRLEVNADLENSAEWNRWFSFVSADSTLSMEAALDLIGPANVEVIEPDYIIEFFSMPTDSLFSYQWYLHNTGQNYQAVLRQAGDFNDSLIFRSGTSGADINLLPLYQSALPEHTKVVVAIVDTGVDPDHPDLQGQFWKNPDEIPANGIDDDHNGFVDDTLGYDISGDILSISNPITDNDPSDIVGHGTHIAGIIAAISDSRGIVGVAPSALIMPVKIRPNATTSVGAAGIMYAVTAGATVINISWGTAYRSLLVEDALRIARLNGVFVAIAAGNNGLNSRLYPAAGIDAFAVAAGDASGLMTSFSTWGPQIQLVAPGQDILSLRASNTDLYAVGNEPGVHIIDSLYYLADGTSMAAPIVASAAALLWSYRPDLSLSNLEAILRYGADDLIDPRSTGDTLPGPDTVSGYGYLNVSASLNLAVRGGVFMITPTEKGRYKDSVEVRIAAVSGYTGGWALSWGVGVTPNVWHDLTPSSLVPPDSVAAIFRTTDLLSGQITFRLTDNFGTVSYRHVTYVHDRRITITSPLPGDTLSYFIPIIGTVYGSDYDSVRIEYQFGGNAPVRLGAITEERFDSTILTWSASGVPTGQYTLKVHGYFASGPIDLTIPFYLRSAFATGWPQTLAGRAGLTPVCADLDHNGSKELIVATLSGIEIFNGDGSRFIGYPSLAFKDLHGIPAVYDVDRDHKEEIIMVDSNGVHAFKRSGGEAMGWPRPLAIKTSAYGFPTPTVTSFGYGSDTVIAFVDNRAVVRAFRLNGVQYFPSMIDGKFTTFSTGLADAAYFNGNSVTATDLNGDSKTEVITTFYSRVAGSLVDIYDGRTGQPAFGRPSPSIISGSGVYGTLLADLNADRLPEIISVGFSASGPGIPSARTIWVKTRGTEDFAGWPKTFPEISGWRGNYPMVADLDLDLVPEILVTFFEYDIGVLYIFRADGTPYIDRPGHPAGEAFRIAATLSSPIVGDLTGDSHPEIVMRGGHILPNTGYESIHILSYEATPIPGWPISTPADPSAVFSTPFAPLIDDIDGDGKAELALISEPGVLYVWDFSAPYDSTRTSGRILLDNRNGGILRPAKLPTDVGEDDDLLPTTALLHQNYPNPFNPTTTIAFDLPSRAEVKIDIYNMLGQRVTRFVDSPLAAGKYEIQFDGSALASGVYFYKFEAGDYRETKKMILLK